MKLRLSKTKKDIQWSFISLAISSLSHLLLRIVLGKDLGASGLGLYTLIFTVYLLSMRFVPFGTGAALTRYIPMNDGNPLQIKEYVSIGLICSFITGSIFCVIIYIFSDTIAINFFHNPEMTYLLKITAFCIPFIAIEKTVLGAINGFRKMNCFAFLNILQNTSVFIISVVLVVFFKMDVLGAVLGFVIPTIMIGFLSLSFIKDQLRITLKLFSSTTRKILWFGFYSVLSASVSTLMIHVDSLLIGHFMTKTEVGYYAVAIILIEGVILIPSAIQKVTTPTIAKYYGKNDYENIIKLIKETMLKTFILTMFLIAFLLIFSKFLIVFLFTEEFLPAYTPLIILLVGYGIRAPFISIGGTLSSIGKVDIAFRVNALSSIINLILNLMLIPVFGIVGAACATSASLVISVAIALYFIKKYTFVS
ncbi:MAG: flippase [Desulfobacteraceae bacterium]|nr:flippase [Desulfobacteraceae bacterium]